MKGFNISPRSSDYAYDSPWTGLWSNWEWQSKIQRDIDLGIGLGGTIVRIIGAPAAVLMGEIPEETYFARMEQVLQYCRSRKVRFYAVGGSVRTWTPTTLPTDALQSHFIAQAQLLERYGSTVFGFDINNELVNAYRVFDATQIRRTVGGWAKAIKAAVPSVRLTVSSSVPHFEGGYVPSPELDPYLDFFDQHVSQPLSARAIASWRAHKPLVLGEIQVRRTDPGRGALYRAIAAAAREGGAEAALTWDIASGDFGLYDGAGQYLDAELAAGYAALSP